MFEPTSQVLFEEAITKLSINFSLSESLKTLQRSTLKLPKQTQKMIALAVDALVDDLLKIGCAENKALAIATFQNECNRLLKDSKGVAISKGILKALAALTITAVVALTFAVFGLGAITILTGFQNHVNISLVLYSLGFSVVAGLGAGSLSAYQLFKSSPASAAATNVVNRAKLQIICPDSQVIYRGVFQKFSIKCPLYDSIKALLLAALTLPEEMQAQIAQEVDLITDILSRPGSPERKMAAITTFHQNCERLLNGSKYTTMGNAILKAIAAITIAATVTLLAGTVGITAFVWIGLICFPTISPAGLSVLGLSIFGATLTAGIAAGASSAHQFFKPSPVTTATNKIVEWATALIDSEKVPTDFTPVLKMEFPTEEGTASFAI